MPDISKIGTVATGNISKVGTVTYDSDTISHVLGVDVPDSGDVEEVLQYLLVSMEMFRALRATSYLQEIKVLVS